MYIIPIAWIYVALMMSVAEATNSNGTVLGAVITFVLYGVLPVALILYFIGTPARKRALRARAAQENLADQNLTSPSEIDASVFKPDASGHAATDPIPPVRKET